MKNNPHPRPRSRARAKSVRRTMDVKILKKKSMKTIISKYARLILADLFLAIMVAGPVCAVGGVIISSLNTRLVGLIVRMVFQA
jgi:hypothetical protein